MATLADRVMDAKIAKEFGIFDRLLTGFPSECHIASVTYVPAYDHVEIRIKNESNPHPNSGIIYSEKLPAFTRNVGDALSLIPESVKTWTFSMHDGVFDFEIFGYHSTDSEAAKSIVLLAKDKSLKLAFHKSIRF